MDKAPDAFRTISEVAEDLDLPQHVLRFWETRFSQIKPMKRGGGRRYYRPDDIDLLRGIRHLLYGEGYTIRGVQRILKDHGGKFVQSVWKAGAPQPQRAPGDLVEGEGADGNAPKTARLPLGPAKAPAAPHADAERNRRLFGAAPMGETDDAESDEIAIDTDETPEPVLRRTEPPPAPPPMRPPPNAPRAIGPLVPTASGPATQSKIFSREDIRKLQAALYELGECRRLVESALAGEK